MKSSSRFALMNLSLIATIIAAVSGCGGGGSSSGLPNPSASPSASPVPQSVSITASDGLVATISEPNSVVSVNGSVIYTLTLANPTNLSVPINSTSPTPVAPDFAIIIKNSGGVPVYTSLPGAPPLDSATIAPGQSLTTTITINSAYASAGTYSAYGAFEDPSTPVTAGPLTITAQ